MCTAIAISGEQRLFGRTLDLETSYGESVVTVPRRFRFDFRHVGECAAHSAIIGTAHVIDGQPLFYDAVNESGVGIAALNFPKSATYHPKRAGRVNLASYEVIPWVLCNSRTVAEAAEKLREVNVTTDKYSEKYAATPLHWMISDACESYVAEPLWDGLRIVKNRFSVMTNEPPFQYHEWNISNYMGISSATPENKIAPNVEITPYSRGMGAIGLPGDYSSVSRFVRAVFAKEHTTCCGGKMSEISRFFHVMGAVSTPSGCILSENGDAVRTVYTSCADIGEMKYYFTTYGNSRIRCVSLRDADGAALGVFPMDSAEDVLEM